MSTSNLTSKISFNDILDSSTKVIYKQTIEIFNNQTFTLQFNNLQFRSDQQGVNNVELLKIKVDWGDGKNDTIFKRLFSSTSSIGMYQESSWKKITHQYNTDKKNVYLTDDVRSLPKIEITLYNTFNDVVKIYIPYKLVYKSLYDLGTSFKMLSANIANDNHSSFVLKNTNDESMMVVGVKNWKKIYGEDDIVYIEDDFISKDYADEYVNEDSLVWDWDAVPQIALNVKLMSDGQISWFECDFSQKTVNLDSWTPKCFFMKNGSDDVELTRIVKNQSLRKFYIYNLQGKPLDIGMYKIYVEMVGVNDVQGTSNIKYIKSDQTIFSDKLQIPLPFVNYFYSSDENNKNLTFYYSLPQYAYTSHIDSAFVELEALKIDENDESQDDFDENGNKIWEDRIVDGIMKQDQTEEIYIESFKSPYYTPLVFSYQLNFDEIDKPYFTTTIPCSSIPNGQYNINVKVRQKTKTLDDDSQENIYTYVYDEKTDTNIKSVYTIPKFTLTYNQIGDVLFDQNCPTLTVDQCKIEWEINNPLQIGNVLYRVSKLDEQDKIQSYVNQKTQFYQNFNYVQNENSYKFTQTLKPQLFDDGKYRIEVGHVLPMSDYVGQRQIIIGKMWNYVYETPDMKIDWFVPYLKKGGVKMNPFFNVSIKQENGEEVDGVEFNYTVEDQMIRESFGNKLTNEFGWNAINNSQVFDFSIKAFNTKDSIYKRKRKSPTVYSIESIKQIPSDLLKIPFTNENISSSVTYVKVDNPLEQIGGANLIKNTSYNIPKKCKWLDINTSKVYYSYDEQPFYFTYNNKPTSILFKLQKYYQKNNPKKVYSRYVPVTQNEVECDVEIDQGVQTYTMKGLNLSILPSVEEFLSSKQIKLENTYDKESDTCILAIKSNQNLWQNDPSEIHDAIVTLKKIIGRDENGENVTEDVYVVNLRSNFNISIGSLPLGSYQMNIQFHSADVDNTKDQNYTISPNDEQSLNLMVKDSNVMECSHSISSGLQSNYKFFNINWTLFHKQLNKFNLKMKVTRHWTYQWKQVEVETDKNGNKLYQQGKYYVGNIKKYKQKLDENGKTIPIYTKDSSGNEYQRTIILQSDQVIYDTERKLSYTGDTTNQTYQIPIVLMATDKVEYYFDLDGDYISWDAQNVNHTIPYKKVVVTI